MKENPAETTDLGDEIEDWDDLEPRQRAYLACLAKTCHHGESSGRAGVSRITAWRWRSDPKFLAAYEVARTVGIGSVEDGGVAMCSNPETFSSQVWGRIMEANDPRYRQKRDLNLSGSVETVTKRIVLAGPEIAEDPDEDAD